MKAWVRRGSALMKRGRFGLAAADFQEARRLEPANAQLVKLFDEAVAKFRYVCVRA